MRRRAPLAVFLVAVAGPLLGSIVPACSSSNASGGDAGDGGLGPNQPANHPCDPSLPSPCLAAPPCSVIQCDEYSHLCVETFVGCTGLDDGGFAFETGTADAHMSTGCQSDYDCPHVPASDSSVALTFACVFSAYDGCTSKGVCVLPEPPLLPDGAVQIACGCNGAPVPYVTDTQTAAPVASPGPCIPPVTDAGHDAADGAGQDAGQEGQDGATDAAGLDASGDG